MSFNRIIIDFKHEKKSDWKELYQEGDISTFSSHPVNYNGLKDRGVHGGNSDGEGELPQHKKDLREAAAADGYTEEEIDKIGEEIDR